MSKWGFDTAARIEKNTKQIQKIMDENVTILVGFPSGRKHIEARHIEDEDGKRHGAAGVSQNDEGEAMDTAELAKQLHYGTATIPARPFLEEGLNKVQDKLNEAIGAEIQKLVEGGAPNWDKIGTMAVGAINEFVRSDHYKTTVPNSQKTIEAKGSDTPLIDSADMINALQYIVEAKR